MENLVLSIYSCVKRGVKPLSKKPIKVLYCMLFFTDRHYCRVPHPRHQNSFVWQRNQLYSRRLSIPYVHFTDSVLSLVVVKVNVGHARRMYTFLHVISPGFMTDLIVHNF